MSILMSYVSSTTYDFVITDLVGVSPVGPTYFEFRGIGSFDAADHSLSTQIRSPCVKMTNIRRPYQRRFVLILLIGEGKRR